MRYRILLNLLTLAVLLVVTTVLVSAGVKNNPAPLAGFTHSPLFTPDDSPQGHGVLLSGSTVIRSSPVIAEIDGNTADGKEVAVGGSDGMVYVYKSNGALLWAINVMPSACSVASGDSVMNSSPAVGQLYGDGVPYVVIGYGTIQTSNCDGGVVALTGPTGNLKWRYSLTAVSPNESLHGVVSAPALADTDGDGKMEIGFGGMDRNVHLLNYDGTLRWRYNAADTVWSSAAFLDIDGDSKLEMIVTTDISANPLMVPPTLDGGYVYAFKTQSRSPSDMPFGTGYIWRTYLDQAIYSSPSIGDVLPSNPGAEIVIGSGVYFPTNTTNKLGRWVKILRPSDGAVLATLNSPAPLRSSPALGDIDDDGKLEVVATIVGDPQYGGDGKSKVIAWDPETGAQKWITTPTDPNSGSNDPNGDDLQSPVIADLDGNGSLEVIVANFWSVHILRGTDGVPLTCQNPSCGSQLSLFAWYTVKSTPAVGDLNGDGKLEIVIGGGHIFKNGRGLLYVWTNFAATSLGSPRGQQAPYSAPWPIFHQNARRTGIAGPVLYANPSSVNAFYRYGSGINPAFSFTLTNIGDDGTMNWGATKPSTVTLSATNGSISSMTNINGSVNASGYVTGTYLIGTIVITGTSGGQAVSGSPQNIPVTLHVGIPVFLPFISR